MEMVHLSSSGRILCKFFKFSVNSSNDTEFVHMLKVEEIRSGTCNANPRMCQHSLGKQDKVKTHLDDVKICLHLQVMLKNYASWETLMYPNDEDDDDALDGDIEDNHGDENWSSHKEHEREFDDRDFICQTWTL